MNFSRIRGFFSKDSKEAKAVGRNAATGSFTVSTSAQTALVKHEQTFKDLASYDRGERVVRSVSH